MSSITYCITTLGRGAASCSADTTLCKHQSRDPNPPANSSQRRSMADDSAIKCYEDASSAEAKPALSALTNVNTGLVHSELLLESSPRGSPRRRLPPRPPPARSPAQRKPHQARSPKRNSFFCVPAGHGRGCGDPLCGPPRRPAPVHARHAGHLPLHGSVSRSLCL